MTTARDLLARAYDERGSYWPEDWANDIAATPSGAELLRRADEGERLRDVMERNGVLPCHPTSGGTEGRFCITHWDERMVDDNACELRRDWDAALATPATDDAEPDPTALLG